MQALGNLLLSKDLRSCKNYKSANLRYFIKIYNFASNSKKYTSMSKYNRLKVVLVEQNRTGKWLADELRKFPCTISKWC